MENDFEDSLFLGKRRMNERGGDGGKAGFWRTAENFIFL
jgi:hypothetical protein